MSFSWSFPLVRFAVQADAAVERLKRQLRPASAGSSRNGAVGAINPWTVAAAASFLGNHGHVEIGVDRAVQLFEVQVGVEPVVEVDLHLAVQGVERGRLG